MGMNRKRPVTRADIAKASAVSETIVSYVINGNRYVNSAKRQRVLDAIETMKYKPNHFARALKGKKSNHILFIADDIEGDYFGKLIREIDSIAYRSGYFVTLCADHDDDDFVQRIYSHFFDGIIIGSAKFPLQNIQRLVDAVLLLVLLEIRDYSKVNGVYGLINTGLYQGARECVKYLYDHGRKHLLYIDRIDEKGGASAIDDWRLKGFIDQLREFDLTLTDDNIITGCSSEQAIIESVRKIFSQSHFVPDGIVGRNDYSACIAMKAVKTIGLSVPNDVAIVGFDNSRLARFSSPALTSMEIRQKEIGTIIMDMLNSLIDERASFTGRIEQYLETKLVVREST